MNLEEKYIINLLKSPDENKHVPQEINFNLFINILIDQKIFLHFYTHLLEKNLSEQQRKFLVSKYEVFRVEREKNLLFFKKIIEIINKCNINYYVYKGIALEKLIYNCHNRRMYDDMDIIMENYSDIKMVKEKIKLYFPNVQEYDNLYNDILGETKLTITIDGELFIVEFKTEKHLFKVRDFSETITLNIEEQKFKTFSLEVTFLQLVSYYYEFTENIEIFRYLDKYILKYPLDFYLFLKKYKNSINWSKLLNLSQEYAMIHKVRLAIINVSELFNDSSILKILNYFPKEKINYRFNGIIDKGSINWIIPLKQRFFYIKEITNFLIKFSLGEFWLENNNNLFDKQPIKICFNDNTSLVNFELKKEDIIIIFSNSNIFDKNIITYINIFGYRQSGDYIDPFIPICIRKNKDKYLISSLGQSCRVDINYELETKSLISKENVEIHEEDKKIKIIIKISKFPHKINLNSLVALNLYLYKTCNSKVVETWNLNPYYELPLRLK